MTILPPPAGSIWKSRSPPASAVRRPKRPPGAIMIANGRFFVAREPRSVFEATDGMRFAHIDIVVLKRTGIGPEMSDQGDRERRLFAAAMSQNRHVRSRRRTPSVP